ncbi:MAG: hypothetical protein U0X76_03645 [Bacteroidia bacterium]
MEAGDFCPSQRVEVHVTITTATAPVAVDNSRCGPGTVVLSATSADPVYWYTTQYGGSSIATGYNFDYPNLTPQTPSMLKPTADVRVCACRLLL